jgi:hypothetical protein
MIYLLILLQNYDKRMDVEKHPFTSISNNIILTTLEPSGGGFGGPPNHCQIFQGSLHYTVNSRFKKDLKLQIHLHKAFFLFWVFKFTT